MKIYLVEDHPIFRRGLRELLNEEADMEVCGEADEISKAHGEIVRTCPDAVIVDISLKGRSGLELVKQLGQEAKHIPVLVLSTHEETVYAERALRAGAKGYIQKHETAELIVKGIRDVVAGKICVSDRITAALLAKSVGESRPLSEPLEERFSDRELEVFVLYGKGMTTNEISSHLSLSPKTIGTYRERIKEKLGLKNSTELIHHAVRWVEQHRE